MKNFIMVLMAAFMMTGTAVAQETKERKQMSETEMIKQRTDRMVKQYGLDESQSAKLLELNTQFAKKLPRRGMGPRGQRGARPEGNGQRGARPEGNGQGGARPEGNGQGGVRPEGNGQRPEGNGQRPDFAQMRKNMEEYNAQLKTILSEDQYKSYQADMEKMRQRGPRQRNTKTSR